MTREPGDRGPAVQRWRLVLVAVAGGLLLAALVTGVALSRDGDEQPAAELKVGWGGSEGHPSCVYDSKSHTVRAKIRIDGSAPRRRLVTVTISAYADENTSELVGTGRRSVPVEGTVHVRVTVPVPTHKPPFVDIDGETACRLSVKD